MYLNGGEEPEELSAAGIEAMQGGETIFWKTKTKQLCAVAPRRGMAARCNAVRHPGAEYSGSVGIWGGYLIGASVQGNTVEQTPYSAISLGWGCGAERLN